MASELITLLNYSPEETIKHSGLVVVKGIVQKEGEENFETLFQVCLNSTLIPHCAKSKQFVLVLELIPGENQIDFIGKLDTSVKQSVVLNYSQSFSLHKVVPLLVLCEDSEKANVKQVTCKIELAMKIIQNFFMQKLLEHGLEKKSFELQCKTEIVTLPITTLEMKKMTAEQVWECVACHIQATGNIWSPHHKYSAFILDSCKQDFSVSSPEKIACGGGGLSLLGFNSFQVWPRSAKKVLTAAFCESPLETQDLRDLAYQLGIENGTKGTLYCASMGALAHELGHTFDLGHSAVGLMGKDFIHFSKFFEPVQDLEVNCLSCLNVSKLKGKGSGNMRRDFNNSITLTHSSATILFFHRWFNSNANEDPHPPDLSFVENKVVSKFPITAVEIRDTLTGWVLKDFEVDANCFQVPLFKKDISIDSDDEAKLFAQNSSGNMIKVSIYRSNLRNSFTPLKRN